MEPDFIGLGVQKGGTSWIYACLYEHPQICMPQKEIHFFSRQRNWKLGFNWYEDLYENNCNVNAVKGEFSTTYFSTKCTAKRIKDKYPNVKLIVSLRNPIDRAFSNYINDVKVGVVNADTTFEEALKKHKEYLDQGKYKSQIEEFLKFFSKEQFLVLIYEDSKKDPNLYIKMIYEFLGVDSDFIPSMLTKKINIARVPKSIWIDKIIRETSQALATSKLGRRLWWIVKSSGLPNKVRKINSQKAKPIKIDETMRNELVPIFEEDISFVEQYLGRTDLNWRT